MGGAISSTSKVAMISRSQDPEYDVVYNFGQVSIDRPLIDYKGNCGNISSAVGPFAVDEGLVNAQEPVTTVRIHQKNTNTLIVAEVPVKDGRYNEEGDYVISGVPNPGGKITLHFFNPGGAVTGTILLLVILPPLAIQMVSETADWIPGTLANVVSGIDSSVAIGPAILAIGMWALVPAAIGMFAVARRYVVRAKGSA